MTPEAGHQDDCDYCAECERLRQMVKGLADRTAAQSDALSKNAERQAPPPAQPTSRQEILDAARGHVTRDRQNTYGKPEDHFSEVAAVWSVYLGARVNPHDVAAMMALLKVMRIKTSPRAADNWVDLAGYAACGGEVATRDVAKEGGAR